MGRLDEAESVGHPAFSRDGKRVALTLFRGGTYGIGVYDLERGLLSPLPLTGDALRPTWTAEGDRLTFLSNAGGGYNLHSIPFDGSGRPQPLFPASQGYVNSPSSWSPDGRSLVYARPGDKTGWDLWLGVPGQEGGPKPLLVTPANESAPAVSPDGRSIAYQSDESGALEIYVRPFPQVEKRRELISRTGGTAPKWSRDGREIFYLSEQGLMRVPVTSARGSATLSFGQPSLALEMTGLLSFDVAPDGRTFAIARVPIERAAREIRVVINWLEELKLRVPTR